MLGPRAPTAPCWTQLLLGRRKLPLPRRSNVREEGLLQGVLRFFGERVFGPSRRDLFEKDLRSSADNADRDRQVRIVSLRKAIERIEARQARQVRNLERDDDPVGVMFRQVRDRLRELEAERTERLEQLQALEAEERRESGRARAVELLEALPVLPAGLPGAPEGILRHIFEWFQLQVTYDKHTNLGPRPSLHQWGHPGPGPRGGRGPGGG